MSSSAAIADPGDHAALIVICANEVSGVDRGGSSAQGDNEHKSERHNARLQALRKDVRTVDAKTNISYHLTNV